MSAATRHRSSFQVLVHDGQSHCEGPDITRVAQRVAPDDADAPSAKSWTHVLPQNCTQLLISFLIERHVDGMRGSIFWLHLTAAGEWGCHRHPVSPTIQRAHMRDNHTWQRLSTHMPEGRGWNATLSLGAHVPPSHLCPLWLCNRWKLPSLEGGLWLTTFIMSCWMLAG